MIRKEYLNMTYEPHSQPSPSGMHPASNFYDLNLSKTDRVEMLSTVSSLYNFARDHGTAGYFGDNLVALNRIMAFKTDEKFTSAINTSFRELEDVCKAWRLHVYSWACRSAMGVPGDLVECGVYRGLYVDTAIKYLGPSAFEGRVFWLYDSFDGLDPRYSTQTEMNLCADHYKRPDMEEEVRTRFAPYDWVRVTKGTIPDILQDQAPMDISFLHLDLNAGDAEVAGLEILYDRVTEGGIILLDDYGRVEHYELFSRHAAWFNERGQSILELPTGQGMIIKIKS